MTIGSVGEEEDVGEMGAGGGGGAREGIACMCPNQLHNMLKTSCPQ